LPDAATARRVEPDVYTGEYYLTHCHGHEDFARSSGHDVGPRFAKALALAGDLRGARVLDVGCGRGELVLQSALRGGYAWGIDYASTAVAIAGQALASAPAELRGRMHVANMDIKALDFADGFFDRVFMLDVVEHLYPDELAQAFAELARVVRPGGRVIMHTSPNKVFEDQVYPNWSRHVNEAALWLSELAGHKDLLFNKLMLPTKREFPKDSYERAMHINGQTLHGLRRQVEAHGFKVRSAEFWEPPLQGPYFRKPELNAWLTLLDFVRFLRPLSRHAPLSGLFCNHMWLVAERC
jgi:cyclopropane fatty-acyl-phospholipid synthase-like methyltransferase